MYQTSFGDSRGRTGIAVEEDALQSSGAVHSALTHADGRPGHLQGRVAAGANGTHCGPELGAFWHLSRWGRGHAQCGEPCAGGVPRVGWRLGRRQTELSKARFGGTCGPNPTDRSRLVSRQCSLSMQSRPLSIVVARQTCDAKLWRRPLSPLCSPVHGAPPRSTPDGLDKEYDNPQARAGLAAGHGREQADASATRSWMPLATSGMRIRVRWICGLAIGCSLFPGGSWSVQEGSELSSDVRGAARMASSCGSPQ